MSNTERWRAMIAGRRAAGQCVRCKAPVTGGRWRCAVCTVENRQAGMRSYETAKKRGLCPGCRTPWKHERYITCTSCRDRSRARFRKVRAPAPRKYESAKWKAIDEAQRCGRCALIIPCGCPYIASAAELATRRPGDGRTYPGSCA